MLQHRPILLVQCKLPAIMSILLALSSSTDLLFMPNVCLKQSKGLSGKHNLSLYIAICESQPACFSTFPSGDHAIDPEARDREVAMRSSQWLVLVLNMGWDAPNHLAIMLMHHPKQGSPLDVACICMHMPTSMSKARLSESAF